MYVLWEHYRYTGNIDVPVILPLSPHCPPPQTFCLFFLLYLSLSPRSLSRVDHINKAPLVSSFS